MLSGMRALLASTTLNLSKRDLADIDVDQTRDHQILNKCGAFWNFFQRGPAKARSEGFQARNDGSK
jgi:hypothetical protein